MSCTDHRVLRGAVACGLVAILTVWLIAPASWSQGRNHWQQPERVIAEMDLEPGQVVADVGCGAGYFTFRLADAVGDDGKVFGVDIDRKALDKLESRAEREGVGNIELIQSEATDTKLQPASVDATMLCMVLHHAPEKYRQGLLESIAQAIKPGGRLFVLDLRKVKDPPFHTYEQLVAREEVIEKAERAGLRLDAEYYYLRYQYFLRFVRPEDSEE